MDTELIRLAAIILVLGLGLSLVLCCLSMALISIASIVFYGIEALWDRWNKAKPQDNSQKGGT